MCPLVSVIIPNYNHAPYLDARLQSVIGQTVRDIEILFLDDASTDDSLKVLEKYRHDRRIQLHTNSRNSGSPFHQWDKGVDLAHGEFVWIAESDDCADSILLETLVPRLKANPAAKLAYCNSWLIDRDDMIVGSMNRYYRRLPKGSRWLEDFTNSGSDECARYMALMNTVPNASAVLFRRGAYREVGGAQAGYRLCGDWYLWVRLLLRGDVIFVSQHLNRFRRHPQTVRATAVSSGLYVKESYGVVQKILQEVRMPQRGRARSLRNLASLWVNHALLPDITEDWTAELLPIAETVDPAVRLRLLLQMIRYATAALIGLRRLRVKQAVALLLHLLKRMPARKSGSPSTPVDAEHARK